ncbi:uncharacterized protein LOC134190037 [Corticium candelabrum]|uniref:uncharacterized protein LOC134190037 n=1 Tax=Corticium candelabrum TaxID=121492 RepID=UPI002E25360C|nr:uncharacterized protein LOC134190037 [Corticium candelabrum]
MRQVGRNNYEIQKVGGEKRKRKRVHSNRLKVFYRTAREVELPADQETEEHEQQGSNPGEWVNQEPDVIHILVEDIAADTTGLLEAEEVVAVAEEPPGPARPHRQIIWCTSKEAVESKRYQSKN